MQTFMLWLLIAGLLILAFFFGFRRSRPPAVLSPAEFTQEFAKRLRPMVPNLKVEVRAEKELRITRANGKESTAFLDNAYTQYVRDPRSFSAVMQTFSAGLLEFPGTERSLDRSRVVPIVKDRRWVTEIRQSLAARGAKNPPENVFDDLNEQLIIVYAVDNPKSIHYLTPGNLAKMGIARGDLRRLAVENLKRLLPKIEVVPGPLFSLVKADGNYEASLLLLKDLWEQPRFKVSGDTVVAVPTRDVLLVTGSRNPAGIAKLREMSAQLAARSPYHLTSELFVYRDGAFKLLPQQ